MLLTKTVRTRKYWKNAIAQAKSGHIELKREEQFSVTINLAHMRPLHYPETRDGKEFYSV